MSLSVRSLIELKKCWGNWLLRLHPLGTPMALGLHAALFLKRSNYNRKVWSSLTMIFYEHNNTHIKRASNSLFSRMKPILIWAVASGLYSNPGLSGCTCRLLELFRFKNKFKILRDSNFFYFWNQKQNNICKTSCKNFSFSSNITRLKFTKFNKERVFFLFISY